LSEEEAGVRLRDLTLRAGGRTLLEGVSADFPAGRVTLVVGASGAGKTLLLRLLAGLLETEDGKITASGSLSILGAEPIPAGRPRGRGAAGRDPSVGIIFQSFALFDELSTEENIRFALDHRPGRRRGGGAAGVDGEDPPAPAAFLAEFGLPRRTPVSALSGGEKQRLAIARTLAYDPPVILYDEPTSGLDPANSARVARRLRDTARAHGKTTVVVTHDYEHLAPVADAIYLLDTERRTLEEIPAGKLAELATRLAGPPGEDEGRGEQGARPGGSPPAARAAQAFGRFFEGTERAVERALLSLLFLPPLWRRPRWGLRYLRHYLSLLASPSAWLYFGAAGLIAGFVSTHFVFKFLPYKQHTDLLFRDEILNGLGFALYRILVPVLLTILLAARCGAAVASDIGNRLYGHQADAMRSLGASPERYLLTAILWAFLVATPLLVGFGFWTARLTSLVVFTYNYPDAGPDYWASHFHRDLIVPGEVFYRGSWWLLAKLVAAGFGIGAAAYHVGMLPKTSVIDVSRHVTTTIIAATLYVLLVHFTFAFLEF
jgi:ABC-type multidrug transport system ATPase subunit/ABC-type transporter Mla maintaining outer membrane lipid asymmetry permease subunit MlaE